jgi:hypothetical protein
MTTQQEAATMVVDCATEIAKLRESLLPLVPFPEAQYGQGVLQILHGYAARARAAGFGDAELVTFGFTVNTRLAKIFSEQQRSRLV